MAVGRLPPLNLGRLLVETVRTAAMAPLATWAVVLLWSAAQGGYALASQRFGRLLMPDSATYVVGSTLFATFLSAAGSGYLTRAYLGRVSWRIDRGLAAFTAIAYVLIVLRNGPRMLPSLLMGASLGGDRGQPQVDFALLNLMAIVVSLVVLYPIARLTLWPTGKLIGDERAQLGFSWRAMGGWAVWSYLAAYVVISTPGFLLTFGSSFLLLRTADTGTLGMTLAGIFAAMILGVLSSALRATAYRQRMPQRAEDVGEIFA
jgi:hypothetical protein